MSSTPDVPKQHADLDALRKEIDELQAVPEEDMVSPQLGLGPRDLDPEPTDSIGYEDWKDEKPTKD